MTVWGVLQADAAAGVMRVGLDLAGDAVLVNGEGGARQWSVPYDRVRFRGWRGAAAVLEVGTSEVLFTPEDRTAFRTTILPALRREERTVAAGLVSAPGAPPHPLSPPRESIPEGPPRDAPQSEGDDSTRVVVDLTDRSRPAGSAAGEGLGDAAPSGGAPQHPWLAPVPLPIESGPDHAHRKLWLWGAVGAVAAVVATLVLVLLRPAYDPGAEAERLLSEAGLTDVAVEVDDGAATVTGTAGTIEEADRMVSIVSSVTGVESVDDRIVVPAPSQAPTTIVTSTTAATGLPDPQEAAGQAVAGISSTLTVEVLDGIAVVSGLVATEADRAAVLEALSGLEGIDGVDDRTSLVPAPAELEAQAANALATAGFGSLSVQVVDGEAQIRGVVPIEALSGGLFAYGRDAEEAVQAVPGIRSATSVLQLRGDEAALRSRLRQMTEESPIEFGFGESALTAATRATLDQVAEVITANPGLRVLVAGHADAIGSNVANEALSSARAQAVVAYLIGRGVAGNRLAVVAYGELFPTASNESDAGRAINRRVEFEVAA